LIKEGKHMRRDLEMVIRIPKEMEEYFRTLVVLHGGQIVEVKKIEEEEN
jgi:hypothetical protein